MGILDSCWDAQQKCCTSEQIVFLLFWVTFSCLSRDWSSTAYQFNRTNLVHMTYFKTVFLSNENIHSKRIIRHALNISTENNLAKMFCWALRWSFPHCSYVTKRSVAAVSSLYFISNAFHGIQLQKCDNFLLKSTKFVLIQKIVRLKGKSL